MQKFASVSALIVFFLLLIPHLTKAQNKQIKGKVISDSTKEALIGVTVHVKGKAAGTSTQADGTYTLTADGKASTLIFSSVGYETQEVPIGSGGEINVSLKLSAANSLSQVVVVGYGSLKRNQLTSAVADVKPEDFNQGGARNVMDLIQGKVAGVNITRSGGASPNQSPVVQIRAATSFTGSNGPLIVIDGIPGGNLDLLQQDDIASFDVLKDGSAAAIYGTQANGGVILITTKKGRSGPPRFDYNSYVSKLYVRQRPDFLTASEYRQKAETITSMQPFTTGAFNANVDMFDSVINHDNVSNYHNLAMTGGGPNGNYRASVYYSNFEGIGKADARQQYGARFSLNQRGLDNRLSVQIDLVTNYNKANLLAGNLPDGNIWLNALTRLPTMPTRDSIGGYYSVNGKPNPISDLALESYTRDQNTNSADGKVSLEIWKGIRASVFGSITRDSWEDNQYRDLLSDDSRYNGDYPGGGYAQKASTLNTNYAFTPTLEYNRSFGDHTIAAVAGYNYQYEWASNWSADNRGFQNDLVTTYNLGSGQASTDGKENEASYKESDKLIAFFGRVNYSFLDKYILQATFRREGSSKFGANHKWGNFPSISAGWDIARENFMKNVGWISQLKLRGGFGVTGNSGIPDYQSLVTLSTGGQYRNPDGVYRQTWGPQNNPNPDLKWEKKAETNIGVDFSMFNNRLTGSVDGFYRKTTDLLFNYNAQQPPYIQPTIYTNVGALSSRGFEFSLSGLIIKNRDFSWKMDLTASTARNKILTLSNQTYQVSFFDVGGIPGAGALGNAMRFQEGGAVGNFYGHKYAGVDASGNWLFYKADGKTKVGLDQITDDDRMVIGNGIPKYYLSWTNSFTYKNWDFRMFWRGRFKYDILNAMDLSYGTQYALPNNVLTDAFTKYGKINATYQYSSLYVQSASFFKLDNITAGYTFKIRTQWIRNLRLYASVSNIAEITKYKGNDPDYVPDAFNGNTNNQPIPGIDAIGAYPYTPSSISYLVGINLGF
ncbi:MAG TPA: SusC/RagA family TonB-linked outer membrane protein [Puia sp.]|nr:SusC/RagA family TonB-linked outer membrane protein [Puia sp.]